MELKANLDILDGDFELEDKDYDIIIVDEHFTNLSCKETLPAKTKYQKSILLTYDSSDNRGCDICLKKPFLPNDIVNILKTEDMPKMESPILDEEEANTIRNLFAEVELTDDMQQNRKILSINPELFLDIIYSINPKRLRKILKGATVTITIDFEGKK
jgi:hypothetical protein